MNFSPRSTPILAQADSNSSNNGNNNASNLLAQGQQPVVSLPGQRDEGGNLLPRQETAHERIQKRDQVPVDTLKKMIRDLHLKVTDQRILILQALQGGRAHVTAQEVYELVLAKDQSVGFATVYRFLRKLTESGYVTEVRMGGLPARYELTPRYHHDHLTCSHCGKICEFENDEIEKLQLRVAEQLGFVLTHHVLELYGICPDCQRREATLAGRRKN